MGVSMRYLLVLAGLMIVFAYKHVIASTLSYDKGNEVAIQGFAPDPNATVSVNGPTSYMFNVRGRLAWQFINYGGGDCFGRILSTNDRMHFPKFKIYEGDSPAYVVHKNTVFLNLSGCTGVLLQQ